MANSSDAQDNLDREYEVIILGGGAAGLMCAISAGQRGKQVLVLERSNRIGKKILMSGGGRCNFTNLNTTAENFISANPHFCKSALARYTPWDFVELVNRHDIAWHEKGPGQLFCDDSAKQIVKMLQQECTAAGVTILTHCETQTIKRGTANSGFLLSTNLGDFHAAKLVIATGGLSIPRMGATDFGHRLARDWGLTVLPLRAGLVPFTLAEDDLSIWSELSGVSIDVSATTQSTTFRENLLFTHRGLSGPAILQLSSYWQPGTAIETNLMPDTPAEAWLMEQRRQHPKRSLRKTIAGVMSLRLAEIFCRQGLQDLVASETRLAELSNASIQKIATQLNHYRWYPSGTEGYRTAEVTLGGLSTAELNASSLECKSIPGLHFIGEVVDVTGQLGGYNFQWAWASGWCAGQAL